MVACIPEMTSYELRNAADEYVDFKEIRAAVERPGYRLPSEGHPSRERAETSRPFYATVALSESDDR